MLNCSIVPSPDICFAIWSVFVQTMLIVVQSFVQIGGKGPFSIIENSDVSAACEYFGKKELE